MSTTRALIQHELGGLAVILIVIWTIIRDPKRVNFNLMAATAGFTTALTTKTYSDNHTNLHINYGNQTTILRKMHQQINIPKGRNVSY